MHISSLFSHLAHCHLAVSVVVVLCAQDNWFLSECLLHPDIAVIDVTGAVPTTAGPMVVHVRLTDPAVVDASNKQGKGKANVVHNDDAARNPTAATAYNAALLNRLSGGNAVYQQLGQINNADYLLEWSQTNPRGVGTQQHQRLRLRSNTKRSPRVLFRARSTSAAHPSQGLRVLGPSTGLLDAYVDASPPHGSAQGRPIGAWVTLVAASAADETYVLNWLCWAQQNQFEHFVFLAHDRQYAHKICAQVSNR
jgi:hypothetical protein